MAVRLKMRSGDNVPTPRPKPSYMAPGQGGQEPQLAGPARVALNPTPEVANDVGQRLLAGLSDPTVRAALLQFGVNMMQPQQGSFMGHLGRSLAAGGAAAGRADLIANNRMRQEQEAAFDQRRLGLQSRQIEFQEDQLEEGKRRTGVKETQADRALRFKEEQLEAKQKGTGKKGLSETFLANKKAKEMKEFQKGLEDAATAAADPLTGSGQYESADQAINDPAFVEAYTQRWRSTRQAAEQAIEGSGAAPSPPGPGAVPVAPAVGGKSDMGGGMTSPAPTVAPAPAAGAPTASPAGDHAATIAKARDAIARGAPREAVIQRLQAAGIPTEGL